MVSNFKKFLIKSLPLAAVLFTCVVILSSTAAYASEGDVLSPSEVSSDFTLIIPEEYEDPVYEKLASGDVRAVHDVNDVYLLLYDDIRPALLGSSQNSNFSLPRIAYDLRWFKTHTMTANDSSIFEDQFDVIYDNLPAIYGSVSQIHGDGQNMTYYLSQINSKLSGSYNWLPISSTYLGNFTSIGGSSANYGNFNQLVVGFTPSGIYSSTPSVYRIKLPIWATPTYPSYPDSLGIDFFATNPYGDYIYFANSNFDYFFEPTVNGTYLYLFDFRFVYDGSPYYIQLSSSTPFSTDAYYGVSVSSIPFDTDDYQQLKQAFYQYKTSNSFSDIQSDVNRLANYLADPNKIAAENASQPVIDDTLSGFTGSGSAAAKTSDTGAMKNMSGSIQSGLDSGASASNATSVFSNQTFWSWFTQSTSDGINSAYPAPVVQQTRGSGDEIPDFLSGNQAELNDLLNQRNSW